MSNTSFMVPDWLNQYIWDNSLREPQVLRELREETRTERLANMQIAPDQGQFMALLARLINARKCLEIGVYTGYSSLSVALALPDDGRLVACDISDKFTQMARRYWEKAGVAHKIELVVQPALRTLDGLLQNGAAGSFDFAFIDADKRNYGNYYERVLALLRPGGLLLVDNVLWRGNVAHPDPADDIAQYLAAFNRQLYADTRIDLSLLPIADGLTVARKR